MTATQTRLRQEVFQSKKKVTTKEIIQILKTTFQIDACR